MGRRITLRHRKKGGPIKFTYAAKQVGDWSPRHPRNNPPPKKRLRWRELTGAELAAAKREIENRYREKGEL